MEGEIMHTIMSIPTLLLCGLLTLSSPAQAAQIVPEVTEPIERRDVAVYDKTETGSITDADALVTTGQEFALSVFNSLDTDRRHIMYGDGTQFSIGLDEELIFIIYNGEFMSTGNAVRYDGRLYLPYTILEKIGFTEERTPDGFGTMSFKRGDAKLQIPWLAEYYVIEKDGKSIENERTRIYHNDILYIPVEILKYFPYDISTTETFPNHADFNAITIGDSGRVTALSEADAEELLLSEMVKIYTDEISHCEADFEYKTSIYTDENYAKLKSDSENISVELVEVFGDYYVFRLNDFKQYIYVNMYSREVYYEDTDSISELYLKPGIADIAELYY